MKKRFFSTILCAILVVTLIATNCITVEARGYSRHSRNYDRTGYSTEKAASDKSAQKAEAEESGSTGETQITETVPSETGAGASSEVNTSGISEVQENIKDTSNTETQPADNEKNVLALGTGKGEENLLVTATPTPALLTGAGNIDYHEGTAFDKVLTISGGTLATGNYYLTEDLALTNNIIIPEEARVNICLNGHTITGTGNGSVITVGEEGKGNCSLVIHSCDGIGCITGGYSVKSGNASEFLCGGAILAYGDLTVDNVKISNNTADKGGGIAAFKNLTVSNSELRENNCTEWGGAILNECSGSFVISDSIIADNKDDTNDLNSDRGAGLYLGENTTSVVEGCEIIDNYGTFGSAIWQESNSQLLLDDSRIAGTDSLLGMSFTVRENCRTTLRDVTIVDQEDGAFRVDENSVLTLQGKVTISGNAVTSWLGDLNPCDVYYYSSNPIQFETTGEYALSTDSRIYIRDTKNLQNCRLTCDYPSDRSYADVFIGENPNNALIETDSETSGYKYMAYGKAVSVAYDFKGHGGTDRTINWISGTKLTRPEDPLAAGYKFGGWYSDSALTKAFDFDTEITSNTTIYAKWTPLGMTKYTVTVSSSLFDFTRDETFEWSIQDFICDDPEVYDTRLAQISLLTMLDVHKVGLVALKGEEGDETVNDKFLAALGFTNFEECKVGSSDGTDADDDANIALAMADAGDGNVVISVSILGTELQNTSEWSSNFDLGADTEGYYEGTGEHPEWSDKDNHKGFEVASNRVINKLREYVSKNVGDDYIKLHFVFTGYSRGAGIANILGAKAEDGILGIDKVSTSRTYTFASPNTTSKASARSYKTIHNLINVDDIITHLPMNDIGMTRYGEDIEWGVKGTDLEAQYLEESGTQYQSKSYVAKKVAKILSAISPVREKLYTIDTSDAGKVEYIATDATSEAEAIKTVTDFFENNRASTYYHIDSVTQASGQYVVTYHIAFAVALNVLSNLFCNATDGGSTDSIGELSKQLAFFATPGFKANQLKLAAMLMNGSTDIPHGHYPLAYFYALYGAEPVSHTCNGVTYSERLRPEGGTLTSGNYYLESDIMLRESYVIPSGVQVNICLNGKSLTNYLPFSNNMPFFIIMEGGELTINDCSNNSGTMTGNKALNGTCFVNQGTLTINGGTYSKNTARTNGGVILAGLGALTTINGGVFTENRANSNGGVIYNGAGAQTIINGCSFTGNTAGGSGGVIYNASGAQLAVNNGTYSSNTATEYGGAICCQENSVTSIDSAKITGNMINDENYYFSRGAGIALFNRATLNLRGTAKIENNKNDSGTHSNVTICEDGAKFTIGDAFRGRVGVSYAGELDEGTYLIVSKVCDRNYLNYFFMDEAAEETGYILNFRTTANMDYYLIIDHPKEGIESEPKPLPVSIGEPSGLEPVGAIGPYVVEPGGPGVQPADSGTGGTGEGGEAGETTSPGMMAGSVFSQPVIWIIIAGVVIIAAAAAAAVLKKKRSR